MSTQQELFMLPQPAPESAAKRQYVEQFGSLIVMNTYLKIAVLALCVVIVVLAAVVAKTNASLLSIKPFVIRINDVGRAEALRYGSLEYQPKEPEIKYFL